MHLGASCDRPLRSRSLTEHLHSETAHAILGILVPEFAATQTKIDGRSQQHICGRPDRALIRTAGASDIDRAHLMFIAGWTGRRSLLFHGLS